MAKIFVNGLSWITTNDSLHDHFSQYGMIDKVNLVTNPETGRSRGFGFVSFTTDEEAAKAVSACNETEFEGRMISVAISKEVGN